MNLDAIAKEFSRYSQAYSNISSNVIIKEISKYSQINKIIGLNAIAKEFSKYSQINLNEMSRAFKIIDKNIFITGRLLNSMPIINDFIGPLANLQSISTQYSSIISKHNDLLNAIGYLSLLMRYSDMRN